jgi:uncharacterized OsmC-like protein
MTREPASWTMCAMTDTAEVTLTLDADDSYRFWADFGDSSVAPLLMDEPEPLGEGAGPNAVNVLSAAVGNCLSASALYCLRRARIDVKGMRTTVRAALERNSAGRLRIGGMHVVIEPVVDADQRDRMRRCMELFEEFCVVTQSVRDGVAVDVAVEPASAPVSG